MELMLSVSIMVVIVGALYALADYGMCRLGELSERTSIELPTLSRIVKMMQADGLHPNALGQPILLDNVWPALEPLLRARQT